MITADQNLADQQNLTGRKLSLIVLSTNRLRFIKDDISAVAAALSDCSPDSFHLVGFPQPTRRASRHRIEE